MSKKPVVLCILDGWGCRDESEYNAIKVANTPNMDRFAAEFPVSKLGTSGADVGLPDGQMGNSEVGHMSIGNGRVILQDLPRIHQAIADGSLRENPDLLAHIASLKDSGGTSHLMGLMSDGGVHAHMDHIIALAEIIASHGVKVAIHAFMDGRDTPPASGEDYIAILSRKVSAMGNVQIATVSGRYYAMDRDNRWERVSLAYDAMVQAKGEYAGNAISAVQQSYAKDVQDEFILPTVLEGYEGMADGDSILMANFRSDRARELLSAFVETAFDGFDRARVIDFPNPTGMVEYSDKLNESLAVLFPKEKVEYGLGQVISEAGLTQLRIAETEKYAHVTFFFNGGSEEVYAGEERVLIPSPNVPTYDAKPEMSAYEVTKALEEALADDRFDVIIVNYANTDMVGHTGNMDAAVQAVEAVDACVGRLWDAVKAQDGVLCISADHGNAEQMVDPATGNPHTSHTTNPVPFIVLGAGDVSVQDGRLCDIAPTLLTLKGIELPVQMTGTSLILNS